MHLDQTSLDCGYRNKAYIAICIQRMLRMEQGGERMNLLVCVHVVLLLSVCMHALQLFKL